MKKGLLDQRVTLFFLFLFPVSVAFPQRMPQENWYYVRTIGTNGPTGDQINNAPGLALSRSNQLYVVDAGNNRVQVFDLDGNFLFRWGSMGAGNGQLNNPGAVCISTNDQVFVCDQGNNRVQVFDLVGGYQGGWPCVQPVGIAYSPRENLVYVAENGSKLIRVYQSDPSGTQVRSWGVAGTLPGQFSDLRGVAVGIGLQPSVYVNDSTRLQLFTAEGEFIRHHDLLFVGYGISNQGPWIAADGTVVLCESSWFEGGQPRYLSLFSQDITEVDRYGRDRMQWIPAPFRRFNAFVESASGMCFFAPMNFENERQGIECFRRTYRTTQPGAVPRPLLLATKQRPGTTFVDVDYRIVDGDSTNVEAAALAFVDGGISLDRVQVMKTFIEGTSANLGTNIVPNQDYHLTWNAGADWATNFGNIKICLLANDGRGLLDQLFLHIPANGPNPALTISRDPVTDADLLNCWLWLVARGDPAITLVSGQVKSGETVLASGTTTTAEGRAFLFARLAVREATSVELQYVREAGISGVIHQWAPRYQVGPLRWPQAVNPWGFDTGTWGPSAWWVVKL